MKKIFKLGEETMQNTQMPMGFIAIKGSKQTIQLIAISLIMLI